MRPYFSSKIDHIITDKIGYFFAINFDFALIDRKSLKQSSSPVVDMFVGHDKSDGVYLCLCKIEFLVVDNFPRSKLLL